jgi:glucokinase
MELKTQLYDYAADVAQRVVTSDFDTLAAIVQRLIQAKTDGKTVYTAGNGGSAATASHFCNDLVKGCRGDDREGVKAVCLADSNAIVTCLANDFSYEEIFTIQLKTLAVEGDVLVAFSGSGRSPNIIAALETARAMGVATIGFSGRDGGRMNDLCDLLLIAPTDSMEQIEDMHLLYEHTMVCAIKGHLTPTLSKREGAGETGDPESSSGGEAEKSYGHTVLRSYGLSYVGAIDIGGTKTMVGIVSSEGGILVKRHFATLTANCEAHLSDCYTHFNACLAETGLTISDLEGIGVNMPGMVDAPAGFLLQAPFAGWYDVNVKGFFARLSGTEKIVVENDVNSCAVGELIFGRACDNFLWVTVSTGIGGAVMIDRQLVSGYNSCAGEIGHVKVEYDHPARCSCGQWGCAEAHGSGTAITRMFAEKVLQNNELSELLAAKNLPADAKSCSLLANDGNRVAIEVFHTAGKYIGRALSYTANLLNPHKIYIGGGVSDSLDLLLPALREEFARATVRQCADIEILKTALAYDAALMGAAALVLTKKRSD